MTYAQINELTISLAHYRAVKRVMEWGKPLVTEDGEHTIELVRPLVVHVNQPLTEPMILKRVGFSKKYMNEYAIQLGHKTVHNFTYTYGNRLRSYPITVSTTIDQVQNTIAKLIRKPMTRRAIMHTWVVECDMHSIHVPCLQTVQFLIRGNHINCIANFRSNDMLMAWGANAYGLARLMEHVCSCLPNCSVGYLETYSTSAHVYDKRDQSTLDKVLEKYEGI